MFQVNVIPNFLKKRTSNISQFSSVIKLETFPFSLFNFLVKESPGTIPVSLLISSWKARYSSDISFPSLFFKIKIEFTHHLHIYEDKERPSVLQRQNTFFC
jgi:hypothetical protein